MCLFCWLHVTRYSYVLWWQLCPSPILHSGLVHHVCSLFTETATLCLDVDNKSNNETAAALLSSLLDILHSMLTYTSGVVRLALQVEDPFPCLSNNPAPRPTFSSFSFPSSSSNVSFGLRKSIWFDSHLWVTNVRQLIWIWKESRRGQRLSEHLLGNCQQLKRSFSLWGWPRAMQSSLSGGGASATSSSTS